MSKHYYREYYRGTEWWERLFLGRKEVSDTEVMGTRNGELFVTNEYYFPAIKRILENNSYKRLFRKPLN